MIQSQVWRKRPWYNSIFLGALETKTDGNSEKDVYWSKQAGPQGKLLEESHLDVEILMCFLKIIAQDSQA